MSVTAHRAGRRRAGPLGRALGLATGFFLIALGLVGVVLPTHLLGLLMVVGLGLVLRSSPRWRRRFTLWRRRHPRWGTPLRRLLRSPPEVAPVAWHELLRSERFFVPSRWRRLARWRRRLRGSARRRAVAEV